MRAKTQWLLILAWLMIGLLIIALQVFSPQLPDEPTWAIGVYSTIGWMLAIPVLLALLVYVNRRGLKAAWPQIVSVPLIYLLLTLVVGPAVYQPEGSVMLGETLSPDGRYEARYGKVGDGVFGPDRWWVELATAHSPFRGDVVASYWNMRQYESGPALPPGQVVQDKPPPPPVWNGHTLTITVYRYQSQGPRAPSNAGASSWRDVAIRYREEPDQTAGRAPQ